MSCCSSSRCSFFFVADKVPALIEEEEVKSGDHTVRVTHKQVPVCHCAAVMLCAGCLLVPLSCNTIAGAHWPCLVDWFLDTPRTREQTHEDSTEAGLGGARRITLHRLASVRYLPCGCVCVFLFCFVFHTYMAYTHASSLGCVLLLLLLLLLLVLFSLGAELCLEEKERQNRKKQRQEDFSVSGNLACV
jgi:hypothetical protein